MILVFNDSHQADGFEKGVDALNGLLEYDSHKVQISYTFIEDYVSDEGEFAYDIKIRKIK